MPQPKSPNRRISSIMIILAGVLFLGAGFNILGATPGPHWLWFLLAAAAILAGIWSLFR
jgi:hypothetical protein